uniref:Polyisoprenoid diphosphate/phosphate phosphohydrolase PLPP6 n=1 Tax=Astyanax mexicanus TaxID=7994 RepID=A0A8B9JH37_ASTMX
MTEFKRGGIVGARLAGESVTKLASLCDASRATVSRVMSAYHQEGPTTSNRINCGRCKRKLSERDGRVLTQIVSKNSTLLFPPELALVRYRRSGMFPTFPSHPRYSFPSAHATRAAMCARFLHARLLLEAPVQALLLVWAALMGLCQVLLGQHNVSGVTLALALGYCQYSLVERCWLPIDRLQDVLLTLLGDGQDT